MERVSLSSTGSPHPNFGQLIESLALSFLILINIINLPLTSLEWIEGPAVDLREQKQHVSGSIRPVECPMTTN